MNKLLIAALGAVLFVGMGCQNDGGDMRSTRKDRDADTMTTRTERTETMRGEDACTHCPGTQTAKADGTCPMCNGKVR